MGENNEEIKIEKKDSEQEQIVKEIGKNEN